MANNSSGKVSSQIVYGVILIVIGIMFLLDNLKLFSMRHIWHYWPLILVIVGGMQVLDHPEPRKARGGWIMLGIGLLLFAGSLGLFQLTMKLLFPCILIGVGIMILTQPKGKQPPGAESAGHGSPGHAGPGHAGPGNAGPTVNLGKGTHEAGSSYDEAPLNITAIMGAYQRSVSTRNFKGGEINTLMGGCELDLRQASFEGEVVLNVLVLMGGVEIRVPNDWTVILQGTPLLGGFDERTTLPANGGKRLIIRGMAIMGGVEVRN